MLGLGVFGCSYVYVCVCVCVCYGGRCSPKPFSYKLEPYWQHTKNPREDVKLLEIEVIVSVFIEWL